MSSDSPVQRSIDQLADLQRFDRVQREKKLELEQLKDEAAALSVDLSQKRAAAQTAREEQASLDLRRRELESHLELENVKMKDRRMRLNRVRNEKELQALRHEIEVGKEANLQVEEEVIGILESLDRLEEEATQLEAELSEFEDTATSQLAEQEARVTALSTELAESDGRRGELIQELEPALLDRYDRIFERRGGAAVVEVRAGSCLGCHMQLPPQFFNELQCATEIRLCPNCHRILHWRADPVDSEETEG